MPTGGKPTLTQFLIEERRRHPGATGDLNALITDVSLACKAIARKVAFGALAGALGNELDKAGGINVQGEEQKALDVLSNDDLPARQRMGRPPRRHGVGGDGRALRAAAAVRARQVPAAVRPARRLVEHRRQRGGGQHLLDPARADARARTRSREDFLQPGTEQVGAGYAIYGPSTMLVLTLGQRHACLHARPDARRMGAQPPEPAHPRAHARVRDQRVEQPLLGAGGEALRRRMPGRPDRAARRRLQHALDRLAGGRDAPHPDARRRVPVPARHARTRRAPAACACSTRPTRSRS